jgi:excisionase family DNA binding protein
MAKLFYTLSEACERLGKTEDEVREMAQSGQIEEMRDGDEVMFKRQQIDLLSGDGEGDALDLDLNLGDDVPSVGVDISSTELEDESGQSPTPGGSGYGLSDSGTGLGLGGSASGLDLGGSGSGFGFDLGDSGSSAGLDLGGSGSASGLSASFEGGEDEDSAETRVSEVVDEELSLEEVGSGSGLLDLTRESDDTSLGAELLDEVWEAEESGEFNANATGLFESAEPEQQSPAQESTPMGIPALATYAYDGKWSGIGVGLLVGAVLAMVAIGIMLVTSIMGVTPQLSSMVSGDVMVWGGGLLGFAIIAALIGMFIGKASE